MPPTLQQRLLALTPRERLFLGVGTLALLLFLLFLLLPGTDEAGDQGGSVELAETPPPPPAPPPATVSYVPVPPPASLAPASAGGVVLKGVLSSGAILVVPPGNERMVPIGREFMPGMRLVEVGVHHAIIAGSGGNVRIELGRPGSTPVQTTSAAPAPSAAPASERDQQRETTQYRLGLEPVRSNGMITGYQIRPGANLPQLQRAGLQPGDVIVRANGSGFNEERMMELSWEIANSPQVEFEFLRGGRKMKAVLPKQ